MKQDLRNRIKIDPKVMGGKPVVKGTRIPLATILELLAEGADQQEILDDYPDLKPEDIAATLAY